MDLSAFTEAVGELHEFLSEQLMKVENVKDQIILIDQFIFKLQQYRERITYRVGKVIPLDLNKILIKGMAVPDICKIPFFPIHKYFIKQKEI